MVKKKATFGGPFLPVPRWVLEYTGGDHVANTVLLFFLQYMDNDSQQLTTSYQHIADQMGCNKRTVIRAIHRLAEIGIIEKAERKRNNRQLTNCYYVNFNNPKVQLGVTPESPVTPESLVGVTLQTLGGDSTDTPGGDSTVTQTILKNKTKKNKKADFLKDGVFVDGRLLDE